MDRRVKERLIGASILVAIVVLVVPELLSGPKPAAPQAVKAQAITPEPFRTVTVDLATSKTPAPDAVEPAISASPAPAAGSAGGTESRNPGSAALVETPAPSPISAKQENWTVQLGSFASRANAEKLLLQLKAQGVTVYVSSGGAGQSLRYRVRTEPLADREAAEKTAAKLKSLGHVSSIVTP